MDYMRDVSLVSSGLGLGLLTKQKNFYMPDKNFKVYLIIIKNVRWKLVKKIIIK